MNNISLRHNDFTKQHTVEFTAGNNLDYIDIIDINDAFNKLANYKLVEDVKDGAVTGWSVEPHTIDKLDEQGFSDLQKDFVRYGILNYGLNFGTSNYSMVLPPNIYKSLYRNYENALNTLVNDKAKLDELRDHFAIEIASNYTDDIKYFGVEPVNFGTQDSRSYQGNEDGVFFDRKF